MSELKNPRHELFCRLYVFGRGVWGNATRCYMEIYPDSGYKTAMNNGPALARKYRWGRVQELFQDAYGKV